MSDYYEDNDIRYDDPDPTQPNRETNDIAFWLILVFIIAICFAVK